MTRLTSSWSGLGCRSTVEDLDDCFRFQVLSLEAPVAEFCEFYGV